MQIVTSTVGDFRQRRGSLASAGSVTPSERALIDQTGWSFSREFLKNVVLLLLTSPPTLDFSSGVDRLINARDKRRA